MLDEFHLRTIKGGGESPTLFQITGKVMIDELTPAIWLGDSGPETTSRATPLQRVMRETPNLIGLTQLLWGNAVAVEIAAGPSLTSPYATMRASE